MRLLWMVVLILAHLLLVVAGAEEVSVRCEIDDHALSAPAEAESSIEDLARYLCGPAKSDEERARAIYRWIGANIRYDVAGTTGPRRCRTPEEVLAEKRGVCSGYSALFSSLCEHSGLEVVVIRGHAKGYGYSVGSQIPEETNHAWNAVLIDGEWRLVDSTWGAGAVDPEEGFVQRFEDFYFLTPPEELVWTHLPEDPSWQLLDSPMSKEEFEGLAYAKPPFFKNEMRIESPLEGTIRADEGAKVTLSAPEDVGVTAELLDERGRKLPQRFTLVRRSKDEVVVRAACPGPGDHILRIYSERGDAGEGAAYDWTLDYRLVAGPKKARAQTGFPLIWDAFWDLGLEVESHPQGVIVTGSELEVVISVPQDVHLLARLLDEEGQKIPEDRTVTSRMDDEYIVRVSFPRAGDYILRIYAKRGGGPAGEYTSVIEYTVVAEAGVEA